MIDCLEQGIIATVPGLTDESRASLVSKMEQYIKEIILFNSAYNLQILQTTMSLLSAMFLILLQVMKS